MTLYVNDAQIYTFLNSRVENETYQMGRNEGCIQDTNRTKNDIPSKKVSADLATKKKANFQARKK